METPTQTGWLDPIIAEQVAAGSFASLPVDVRSDVASYSEADEMEAGQ
jgi:hypothetical protein